MNPTPDHLPVDFDVPFRGLWTSAPSTKIHASSSPSLMNCVIRDGVVKRRAGGYQLGRQLVGKVLGLTEFGPIGEQPIFLALTSHRQYAYDPSTENWVDLTPNQVSYPIIGADGGAKMFTVDGDHVADFNVGRLVPLLNSTANDGIYTVVSRSLVAGDTNVVVSEAIPDDTDVTGEFVIASDLSTGDEDFLDFVAVTDVMSRRFLLTNGVDPPRVWDGDIGTEFVDWTPNYTGFITCKTFAVFAEHLFLGDVTTLVDEPQLIAWSAAGDFDEFETGDAGAQILYQMQNGIRAMKVLGDRLVVYSYDQILMATYVGAPAIFAFEVTIPEGVRLVGPRAITSINVGHVYMSEENFYLFDGSRGLRVLGNEIYTDYKAVKDHSILIRSVVLNDYSKRTIYLSVPDLDDGVTTYTMFYDVFDLGSIVWSKERYYDDVTSWGFFINRDESLTWDDASWEPANTPWSNELGAWNEEGEQLNFPIRTYGTSDGRVVIVTEGALDDRGNEVEQRYETKDFEVPEALGTLLGRWHEVEFEAMGSEVTVEYSGNRGHTWEAITDGEDVTLSSVPTIYRLPFETTSRSLRLRFTSTGNFTLSWGRLWVRPGANR